MYNSPRLDNLENKSLKNLFINGNFPIWQRNTSFTGAGVNFDFTADRWRYQETATTGGVTVARSETVPPNGKSQYSCLITATTGMGAKNTWASTEIGHIVTYVEANFSIEAKGKETQFGVWVQASKTGKMCINFNAYDETLSNTHRFQSQITINQADTWEFKIVDIPVCPANLYPSNGRGITFSFAFVTGTDFEGVGALDEWTVSDGSTGRADDTNWFENTNDYVRISQVQYVVKGEVDLDENEYVSAGRDWEEEYSLCRRYFQKSWSLDEPVGFPTNNGCVGITDCDSTAFLASTNISFNPYMRTLPAMVSYAHNGTINRATRQANSSLRSGNSSFIEANERGCGRYQFGENIPADPSRAHFTADAEL